MCRRFFFSPIIIMIIIIIVMIIMMMMMTIEEICIHIKYDEHNAHHKLLVYTTVSGVTKTREGKTI